MRSCVHSTNKDGVMELFYGNFSPAARQSPLPPQTLKNHICISFSDVTSARRISVSDEAQKILQLFVCKNDTGSGDDTSTGGSTI